VEGEPEGYMSVESEVKRALASPDDFLDVPDGVADFKAKTDNRHRDNPDDSSPAWVVRDGNYISARWPGDAYTFAQEFTEALEAAPQMRA
jgi:putative intracellular protease/amidase